MPTYEYLCTACDNHWEEVQKISADALEVCPKCSQSTAKRQISGGNFILKGGGWYADLYSSQPKKSGEKGAEASGEKSAGKSGEGKSDGAAAPAAAAKSEGAAAPSTGSGSSSGGSSGTSGSSGGSSSGGSSGTSGSSGGSSGSSGKAP